MKDCEEVFDDLQSSCIDEIKRFSACKGEGDDFESKLKAEINVPS